MENLFEQENFAMEIDGCFGGRCQGTCTLGCGGTCIKQCADSCNYNC